MDKMKELYQKVAGDSALQSKFNEIINNAEKSGADETQKKLLIFAKESGYDISIEELQSFFRDLTEQHQNELSDTELDMVAGGKLSADDGIQIAAGVITAASVVAGLSGIGIFATVVCAAGAGTVEGASR